VRDEQIFTKNLSEDPLSRKFIVSGQTSACIGQLSTYRYSPYFSGPKFDNTQRPIEVIPSNRISTNAFSAPVDE